MSLNQFPQVLNNFSLFFQVIKVVNNKTKSVLQLVSHCSSNSARHLYTDALKNFINVTVFGHCNQNPCDEECEEMALSKFSLFDYSIDKFRLKRF